MLKQMLHSESFLLLFDKYFRRACHKPGMVTGSGEATRNKHPIPVQWGGEGPAKLRYAEQDTVAGSLEQQDEVVKEEKGRKTKSEGLLRTQERRVGKARTGTHSNGEPHRSAFLRPLSDSVLCSK